MTKFEYIKKKLIHIHSQVTIDSAFNLHDINITAEDMFMHLLNDVYGLELVNANKIYDNFPTVDLIDEENKQVIQVTSSISTTKINKTLKGIEKFKTDDDLKKYAEYKLVFLYIVEDKKDLSNNYKSKNNLKDENFLDITDILKAIQGKIDIEVKVFETLQKIYVEKVDTIETTAYIEPRDIDVNMKNITITKGDKKLGTILLKTVSIEVDENILNVAIYPVTFEEYDLFCEDIGKNKPHDDFFGRGNRPIINVSWHDAVEYCAWLSEYEKLLEVRLLKSIEWQKIAEKNLCENTLIINKDNSNNQTAELNMDRAGVLGICDMLGNINEWCLDGENERKIVKGGCFSDKTSQMNINKNKLLNSTTARNRIGFRIVFMH